MTITALRGREIKFERNDGRIVRQIFPRGAAGCPKWRPEGERDSVRPKGAFVEIHTPLPPSFLPSFFLSIPRSLSLSPSPSLHVKPRRPPLRLPILYPPPRSSLSHTSLNWQVDRTRRALFSSLQNRPTALTGWQASIS